MTTDDLGLTPEQEYAIERSAVVACGDHDAHHENCRHAWNAAHPDDPVTEEEQLAFQQTVMAGLRRHQLEHDESSQRFEEWRQRFDARGVEIQAKLDALAEVNARSRRRSSPEA
jgi:hypothetical protein